MREYENLYDKFQNNTITEKEKERLFELAFGPSFKKIIYPYMTPLHGRIVNFKCIHL